MTNWVCHIYSVKLWPQVCFPQTKFASKIHQHLGNIDKFSAKFWHQCLVCYRHPEIVKCVSNTSCDCDWLFKSLFAGMGLHLLQFIKLTALVTQREEVSISIVRQLLMFLLVSMLPLCLTSQWYKVWVIPFGNVCSNAHLTEGLRKSPSEPSPHTSVFDSGTASQTPHKFNRNVY